MGTILCLFWCWIIGHSCSYIRCLVGIRKIELDVEHMTCLSPCSQLDYETRLYKGCSASELFSITSTVGCVCIPVSLIAGFSLLDGLHALFIAFAFFVSWTLLAVSCIAYVLEFLKQGKPEGWHSRLFYCSIHPILSSGLVYKSGWWCTVREE